MSVRAKFRVVTKDPGDHGSIFLTPVYSDDPSSENRKFWNATPSGEIKMYITNTEAFKGFELGKEYYVDFTLVEE